MATKNSTKGGENNLVKQLKGSLFSLIYVIILISIIGILGLNKWQVIGLLCSLSFLFMLYGKVKKKQPFDVKKLVKNCVFIIIFVNILAFLMQFGIVGYAFSLFLICAWILFKRWTMFMEGIRRIETMIYGKPLDRDQWEKGEFKNRKKAKLVWKKKV